MCICAHELCTFSRTWGCKGWLSLGIFFLNYAWIEYFDWYMWCHLQPFHPIVLTTKFDKMMKLSSPVRPSAWVGLTRLRFGFSYIAYFIPLSCRTCQRDLKNHILFT
jgi:hypothetical protein